MQKTLSESAVTEEPPADDRANESPANTPDLSVAQIVLAAGASRRMGRPKALLRFGNATALDLVLRAGREAGCSPRVVVIRADIATEARACTDDANATIWVERCDDGPLLSSLQLALDALREVQLDAFVFQPVDIPLVTAADYIALLAAKRRDPSAVVVKPTFKGRSGHPVLCQQSLATALLNLDLTQSPRAVLSSASAVRVAVRNEGILLDMDEPADYERLLSEFSRPRRR